ncbi:IPT/TIG domain-containing protein [Chitinophaga caseinilytica]|uniref:IPT/TIG domain-containing protein n=1 Tax=Chitinophaga caseinilytica TaxID=2267521 RepID=UPI003C2D4BC8
MKKILTYILLPAFALLAACNKDDDAEKPATPAIAAVYPSAGLPNMIITIKGKNFSTVRQDNKVQFNGKAAIVIEASETALQVVTPADGTTGPVTVATPKGSATGGTFTYLPPLEEYTVTTLAGDGTSGSVDGPIAASLFKTVQGVAIGADGSIIVTDRGNNRIRRIKAGNVTPIAGATTAGYTEGTGAAARFRLPWRAVEDAQGNIFVADRDNHAIRKITPAGVVSTVAGTGTAGFADGPVATAQFNQPLDIVVDAAGNLYVADNLNHRIRKIGTDGQVTTLAGNGSAGFANGTGLAAQFRNPSGLELDKDGNIMVADRLNHRIRKVTQAGATTTVAGDGNSGYLDGDAAGARFADPYGITADAAGNIFVADLNNHKIRKVSVDGKVVSIAGGARGFADGLGAGAQLNSPTDVCVDRDGNVYVADQANHAIRKLTRK